MERKIVFVYFGMVNRLTEKQKLKELAMDLRKAGVSDVKINYEDFCIKTPTLCIKGIIYLDSLRALRCDECFGFSREYAISLRKNHAVDGFEGTVIDYVLEQEKIK